MRPARTALRGRLCGSLLREIVVDTVPERCLLGSTAISAAALRKVAQDYATHAARHYRLFTVRSFAERGSQPADKRRRMFLSGLSNPDRTRSEGSGYRRAAPPPFSSTIITPLLRLWTALDGLSSLQLSLRSLPASARRQPCSPSGNTPAAGDGRGGSMRLRPTGVVLQALHWLVVSESDGGRKRDCWIRCHFVLPSPPKKVTNNRLVLLLLLFCCVLIYVWDTKDLFRKQNGWRSAEGGVKEMYLSLQKNRLKVNILKSVILLFELHGEAFQLGFQSDTKKSQRCIQSCQ